MVTAARSGRSERDPPANLQRIAVEGLRGIPREWCASCRESRRFRACRSGRNSCRRMSHAPFPLRDPLHWPADRCSADRCDRAGASARPAGDPAHPARRIDRGVHQGKALARWPLVRVQPRGRHRHEPLVGARGGWRAAETHIAGLRGLRRGFLPERGPYRVRVEPAGSRRRPELLHDGDRIRPGDGACRGHGASALARTRGGRAPVPGRSRGPGRGAGGQHETLARPRRGRPRPPRCSVSRIAGNGVRVVQGTAGRSSRWCVCLSARRQMAATRTGSTP